MLEVQQAFNCHLLCDKEHNGVDAIWILTSSAGSDSKGYLTVNYFIDAYFKPRCGSLEKVQRSICYNVKSPCKYIQLRRPGLRDWDNSIALNMASYLNNRRHLLFSLCIISMFWRFRECRWIGRAVKALGRFLFHLFSRSLTYNSVSAVQLLSVLPITATWSSRNMPWMLQRSFHRQSKFHALVSSGLLLYADS